MFHLHDKTRRRLAIAGFISLCILPTCVIAGWCLWRNLPWETQLASKQLRQQLGWKVKLERLKHPRPGTDVYENLELLDPETGRPIFSCKSVEVSRQQIADPQGEEKSTVVFYFEQPEIDAAALDTIGRLVERVVQDQAAPGMNCRLSTAELNLRREKTVQTFPKIEAGVDHSTGCVQAAMQFHLPGAKAAVPAIIRIYRDRTVTPPQNRFEFITDETKLPSDLIAQEIPELAKLGVNRK